MVCRDRRPAAVSAFCGRARLSATVTARIIATVPSDHSTGILYTSTSSILLPMKASTTARP